MSGLLHDPVAFRLFLVLVIVTGFALGLVALALNRRATVTIGHVRAELNPNSGTSMRDVTDRTERKVDDLAASFAAYVEHQDETRHLLLEQINARLASLERIGGAAAPIQRRGALK